MGRGGCDVRERGGTVANEVMTESLTVFFSLSCSFFSFQRSREY